MKYEDKEAWQLVNELTEAFQYYLLIKASVEIAKEKGACDYFKKTKYPKRYYYPIDTYKKDVDTIVTKLKMDWEALRKDIVEHGLRHSTLSHRCSSESS